MNDLVVICKKVDRARGDAPAGLHHVETIHLKNLVVTSKAGNTFELLQGSQTWTFHVYVTTPP